MATPYFHGSQSREEAEQSLITAHLRNPTEPVFMVRTSSKAPSELVLSTMLNNRDAKFGHFKIRYVGTPDRPLYQLELTLTQPPAFPTVEALLEFYTDARNGPPAPIGLYVPLPAGVRPPVMPSGSSAAPPARPPPMQSHAPAPAPTHAHAQPPPVVRTGGYTHPFPHGAPAVAPPHFAPQAGPGVGQGFPPAHAPPPVGLPPSMPNPAPYPESAPAPSGAPSLPAGRGGAAAAAAVAAGGEDLLCEGYLLKHRGVGQSRSRFFQLTTKKFMYFSENAGEQIASCLVADFASILEVDKKTFRIITREPFGQSNKTEMVLEAPNHAVKNKWVHFLKGDRNTGGGARELEGKMIVEGYLTKVQPMGSSSKERWFVCTTEVFAYCKEEAGELMGSVPLSNITSIGPTGDPKCFKVISNTRFTVTGSYEVLCRADSEAVRNKWIERLKLVISEEKFPR